MDFLHFGTKSTSWPWFFRHFLTYRFFRQTLEMMNRLPSSILVLFLLFGGGIAVGQGNQSDSPVYRIAIIDAYFCSREFYTQYHLQTQFPLGQTVKSLHCRNTPKLPVAFHGHRVLMEIAKNLKSPQKFMFYLINVFTANGVQNLQTWKQAIQFVNKNTIDLVVSASGYFQDNSLDREILRPPLLAAAGNATGRLAHRPRLFPQTSGSPRKYLVGSFLPSTRTSKHQEAYYDPLNMNQNQISFFMAGRIVGRELSGSSLAVALAANFFLNHCVPNSIRDCLEKQGIPLQFQGKTPPGRHKTFPHYPK